MKKISVSLVMVFSILSLVLAGCTIDVGSISVEDAKAKVEEYLTEIGATDVVVKSVTDDGNGVYKVMIEQAGEEFESYMTMDGEKFFQTAMDLDVEKLKEEQAEQEKANAEEQAKTLENIEKKDKPEVELFVMSHCPYGTQAEKGIIPVIETLKDKIDFQLKFVSYAMHGEKEINEQNNQYCIQKKFPKKLIDYLRCFLTDETQSEQCMTDNQISKETIDSCVNDTNAKFKTMEKFEDESTWLSGAYPLYEVHKEDNDKYGVQGSPSLVVNGTMVSTGRDSQSLLNAVCAGFTEKPAECDAAMDSNSPAPGFGWEGSGSGADASCGS